MNSARKRIRHNGNLGHHEFPHGAYAGYRAGCRCDACVQGCRQRYREYMRKHRMESPSYAASQRADKTRFRKTENGRALYRSTNAARKSRVRQTRTDHSLLRLIYCACPHGYVVDHIIPLARNGQHAPDNLQYLPATVNGRKAARLDFDASRDAIRWQDVLAATLNDYPLVGVGASAPKRIAPLKVVGGEEIV